MNQLAHHPFCPEAITFGKMSKEMEKYANCIARWQRFYADKAKEVQKEYETVRRTFLLEEAKKHMKMWRPRKARNLIIKSVAKERREALKALITAGLSAVDTKRLEGMIG